MKYLITVGVGSAGAEASSLLTDALLATLHSMGLVDSATVMSIDTEPTQSA